MFHVRLTKAYNSILNTLKHPKVKTILDTMLPLNQSNPGGVCVRDLLNMDVFKVNDNNGNLNDSDVKKNLVFGIFTQEKSSRYMWNYHKLGFF